MNRRPSAAIVMPGVRVVVMKFLPSRKAAIIGKIMHSGAELRAGESNSFYRGCLTGRSPKGAYKKLTCVVLGNSRPGTNVIALLSLSD